MITVLRRAAAIAVPLVVAIAAAACNSSSSAATTPTGPSTNPTTEIFTGTVPVGGSDTHTFTIALSNGQLNATLTAAGPPSTIFELLGLGTSSNGTCTLGTSSNGTPASAITPAGSTAQLQYIQVPAGTYCVIVQDAGNQTVDITYSVTVTHY